MKGSFLKIFFCLVLCLFVVVPAASASDSSSDSCLGVINADPSAIMRTEPNSAAQIICYIPYQTTVVLLDCSDPYFYQVLYNGWVGYVWYERIDFTEHHFEVEELISDYCTVDSVITYDCMVCGYYYEEVIRPASSSHDLVHPADVISDCTQGAEYVAACQNCIYEVVVTVAPADHSWVFDSMIPSTNCEEESSETYICSVCGMEKTEIISAPGHDLEITYVDGQQITRCLREGCDYEVVLVVPPHDHDWVFDSMTFSSNCEDESSETFVCSLCGEKKTEIIPAPGHDLYVSYTGFAPGSFYNCETGGIKVTHCTRELCTYEDREIIPAGHAYQEVTRVEPTYHSSGTQTMQCSYCGHRDYITIPALVDDGMTDDFFFARSNLLDWRLETVWDLRPRFQLHLWRNVDWCCIGWSFSFRSSYAFWVWRS